MTREHVKIATALEVALCVVLTKVDAASPERIQQSVDDVAALLRLCSPTKTLQRAASVDTSSDESAIPLFLVSNVTGDGLDSVQEYLARLEPTRVRGTVSCVVQRTS